MRLRWIWEEVLESVEGVAVVGEEDFGFVVVLLADHWEIYLIELIFNYLSDG